MAILYFRFRKQSSKRFIKILNDVFIFKRYIMLYNKIDELMRKTGVSAYQISRDTKIPQSAFSRWKKGESNPSLKNIKILSEYFNVPIGYFTDGVEGTPEIKTVERKIDLKKITDNALICYYGDRELTASQKAKISKVLKAVLDD